MALESRFVGLANDLGADDALAVDKEGGRQGDELHRVRLLRVVGHPLAGDGKYGKNVQNKKTGFPYQALYSYKLIFRFTTDAGMLSYLDGREFTAQDVWFLDEFRAFPK